MEFLCEFLSISCKVEERVEWTIFCLEKKIRFSLISNFTHNTITTKSTLDTSPQECTNILVRMNSTIPKHEILTTPLSENQSLIFDIEALISYSS